MVRYVFWVAVGLLMIGLGSALTINDSIDGNVIVKEFGNSLEFNVTIEDGVYGDYNIYTLSDVYIYPSSTFKLYDGKSYENTFSIEPMERLLKVDGSYTVVYTLNHRDVEKFDRFIGIEVLGLADIIEIESNKVELNDDVVLVEIRNLENIELSNLTVKLSSILFDVEKVVNLPAYDSVKVDIPVSNEELKKIKGGVYLVEASFVTPKGDVMVDGNLYLNEEESVNTFERSSGIFWRTRTIDNVNTGNTVEDVRVEVEKNILTRFFTTFNKEPLNVVREGFVVKYVWAERLGPSEVLTISSTTNYLYPILLLLLLYFVFVGLRRFFKLKLIIEKSVTPVRTKNGEFALRVRLFVKAKRTISDVVLMDRIPRTVKIYKKFGISTPDEIDAVTRRLRWNIGDLKAGEERLFTYVVYSRVGYVGKFVLPPAVGKFHFGDNLYSIDSNSVFFLAEQTSKED